MIIDYSVADECENPNTYYACHKCGKCGRKFKNGILVDSGGTHVSEEESEGGQ